VEVNRCDVNTPPAEAGDDIVCEMEPCGRRRRRPREVGEHGLVAIRVGVRD